MMKSKLRIALGLFCAALVVPAFAEWPNNYDKAAQQSAAENKPLLMFFTGSDWCGYCQEMVSEVFETQTFKDYAAKNLVLLELDYPRKKRISPRVEEQNRRLAKRYDVASYPRLILLSPKGETLAQMKGMPTSGLEGVMRFLNKNVPSAAAAADAGWLLDYDAAARKTVAEKKVLMMVFTGSDWCPACERMESTVFPSEEFKAFADKHLVLLKLDFPEEKHQSQAQKEHNEKLAKQYDVKSFPTVILVNAKGQAFARQVGGYKDPVVGFMWWLNRAMAKKDAPQPDDKSAP